MRARSERSTRPTLCAAPRTRRFDQDLSKVGADARIRAFARIAEVWQAQHARFAQRPAGRGSGTSTLPAVVRERYSRSITKDASFDWTPPLIGVPKS